MVKEALIDCSSGKFAKLLLDGEELNGAIRIDKIINRLTNGVSRKERNGMHDRN